MRGDNKVGEAFLKAPVRSVWQRENSSRANHAASLGTRGQCDRAQVAA